MYRTNASASLLQQTPIAIIGMGSIFPEARNLQEYWDNIIREVDCITDVPTSRWSVDDYYDPDPRAPDKTYCKRGGFIPDIDFDPLEFGIPPNVLEATDVSQLLSLVVAKQAMEDAGYGEGAMFNREQVGVILGVATGRPLGTPLGARLQYPIWERVLRNSGVPEETVPLIVERMKQAYVEWQENSFPGVLGNVVAGRIANRLDLGGVNCVVDAACASSLGAVKMAISELVERRCDMMITGGVDVDNSVMMYMCFSKTPAFSQKDNVRPFDVESDGMMVGEGIGMLVLKRLEDAERDGDRIYAVIRGIGTSSDGRYKSIYAPRPAGQEQALERAYEDAGFPPPTVGMIEAHGTGTMAGDPAEVAALKDVFGQDNPKRQYVALGSVKSQIGHTKAAAGAASLIKVALALHHKILPATINVTRPHPEFGLDSSPFYLNIKTRPWMRVDANVPRRAGVSSFGFGGTNFHVVLEEYEREQAQRYRLHSVAEPVILSASTPGQLLAECENALAHLQSDEGDLYYRQLVDTARSQPLPVAVARLGFVAESQAVARELLEIARNNLRNDPKSEAWSHPKGVYYRRKGIDPEGKMVALFSGQGSQYVEMGRELACNMPPFRKTYERMDQLFLKDRLQSVSAVVFPPPLFEQAQKEAQAEALQRTEYAQPAIGAFSVGLYKILQDAGFRPDFVAGHSFGELTALWAAGVLGDDDYFALVKARGQAMAAPAAPDFDPGTMLAVKGDIAQIQAEVIGFPEITVANWNANDQAVLAGPTQAVVKVQHHLASRGYSVVPLPVSAAFHTSLVAHAQQPFARALNAVTFRPPRIPVYSNTTGLPYPSEPGDIRNTLAEHILKPVLFKQQIENIYASGGRYFVEFGPKSILTNLVKNTLGDKPHVAVALNPNSKRDSDRQLREAVVHLRVLGLPLGDMDPYQIVMLPAKTQKGSLLQVRLNGSNYL
ncbi:MAG: acyltransferase domain-containing protein, partial [Chloroflexota bacterium]|nr:acyltransferase domain-containing protein [Chloroflexota bacterium]